MVRIAKAPEEFQVQILLVRMWYVFPWIAFQYVKGRKFFVRTKYYVLNYTKKNLQLNYRFIYTFKYQVLKYKHRSFTHHFVNFICYFFNDFFISMVVQYFID